MARRQFHGFVKMTIARRRARSSTPTRNTQRRLVAVVVPRPRRPSRGTTSRRPPPLTLLRPRSWACLPNGLLLRETVVSSSIAFIFFSLFFFLFHVVVSFHVYIFIRAWFWPYERNERDDFWKDEYKTKLIVVICEILIEKDRMIYIMKLLI